MKFLPVDAPVPDECRTDRILLRPLRASDVELDYDAVMSSAEALRRWSQSDWPAETFTLEENLADLERHEREHLERQAFTYTVLEPDAARCVGCVYIKPVLPEIAAGLPSVDHHGADVGFWVRADELETDLDRHLLEALRGWLASDWAFETLVFSISRLEFRQAALLKDSGLERRLMATLADGRSCWVFG